MNKATTRIAIAAVLVMIAGSSSAQTDLYSTVTNLWWEGPKTNILAIAEERLAANTNDIVGIILKTEYDISFSPATVLSN